MSNTTVHSPKIKNSNNLDKSMDLEYHVPDNYTDNPIEMVMKKSYWDTVYTDILNKDFTKLLNILTEMKNMFKDLIPHRKDIHTQIEEHIDIPFIKQKLEHNVFDTQEFIGLFCCLVDWVKKLGSPRDDKMMDNLRERVIKEAEEKGHMYVLPYAYDTLHAKLIDIHREASMYRQRIFQMIK